MCACYADGGPGVRGQGDGVCCVGAAAAFWGSFECVSESVYVVRAAL